MNEMISLWYVFLLAGPDSMAFGLWNYINSPYAIVEILDNIVRVFHFEICRT